MLDQPPPIEYLFLLDQYSEVRIVSQNEPREPWTEQRHAGNQPVQGQADHTYGFAFPTTISGMTTGSTPAVVAVTIDAHSGQLDLGTIDETILRPYTQEALNQLPNLGDYTRVEHKVTGPQVTTIRVQRHPRR